MKAGPLITDNLNKGKLPETGPDSVPLLPEITLRQPPLSRGPLSVLYTGWDKAHRCHVVVKVQRVTEDAVTLSRFGREAAVMLRLRHPSIVSLYAFHPGDPLKNDPAALVMEYVPGETLAALVARAGFLPPVRAVQIMEEIAAALDCVHGLGIVHRDVKPSNILVPKRGPAKLTDFGVARMDDDLPLTVMGDILGTIEYASPEQVHGKDTVDSRSDVYSLAAVTYFALTGTPPFRAADSSMQAQLSVMHRQVFAEPPPLRFHRAELSPAVEAAVLRGLTKSPDARYASAGQLASALRAAVSASDAPQQAATKTAAQFSGMAAGVVSGVVLVTGVLLWLILPHKPAAPAATVAKSAVPAAMPVAAKPAAKAVKPPIKTASAQPLPAAVHATRQPPAIPVRIAQTPRAKAAKDAALRRFIPKRRLLAVAPLHHAVQTTRPPVRVVRQVPVSREPSRRIRISPRLNTAGVMSHPITADAAPPLILTASPKPALAAGVGWYTVSGWIALANPRRTQKAALVQASPLWIKVDGKPLPALAVGQWAELPAGTHWVTYQPSAGMGVGPKTWAMTLAPAAHLSQQVPLPSAPLPLIPIHLRNP